MTQTASVRTVNEGSRSRPGRRRLADLRGRRCDAGRPRRVSSGRAFGTRRGCPAVNDGVPAASATTAAACTTDASCKAGRALRRERRVHGARARGVSAPRPGLRSRRRAPFRRRDVPATGPDADSYGRSNARAVELAVREINRFAGGVPRRAAAVHSLCSLRRHRRRGRTRRHLAARVPAATGFRSSDEALTLVRDVFVPARVLSVSALNASPLLAQLPAGDPGLLLRATASATAFAEPLARIVSTMLAPRRGAAPVFPSRPRLKVAVFGPGTRRASPTRTRDARARAARRGVSAARSPPGREQATPGRPSSPGARVARPDLRRTCRGPQRRPLCLDHRAVGAPRGPAEATGAPLYVGATPWEEPGFEDFIKSRPERRARFFAVSWPTSRPRSRASWSGTRSRSARASHPVDRLTRAV